MTIQEAVDYLGLERCEFDDECDYCDNPRDGSYASISVSECGQEADFYACGQCAMLMAASQKAADAILPNSR